MNLQETIKKILKEEFDSKSIPLNIRRRVSHIDEYFIYLLDKVYKPENICRYIDSDEFVEVLISAVIDGMYYKYFSDVDDLSDEWTKMYLGMQKYIKHKYGDGLKNYYNQNCVEKQEQNESELTEKCWKGYTQKGMKTMFGKKYPNCVKKKK